MLLPRLPASGPEVPAAPPGLCSPVTPGDSGSPGQAGPDVNLPSLPPPRLMPGDVGLRSTVQGKARAWGRRGPEPPLPLFGGTERGESRGTFPPLTPSPRLSKGEEAGLGATRTCIPPGMAHLAVPRTVHGYT